jgi:hypothetical protein
MYVKQTVFWRRAGANNHAINKVQCDTWYLFGFIPIAVTERVLESRFADLDL